MNTKKNIFRSSLVRNIQLVCSIAISFYMTPFIVRSLGDRLYGYWSLIGALIGYYGLLDLGISSAVERYISQAIGRKDIDSISTTASTSLYLFSIISVFSLIITVLLALSSQYIFHDKNEIILLRKIILILGITISIGIPFKVYSGVISSFLRYDYLSIVSISRTIISNILIYFLLINGYSILMMSVVSAFMSIYEMLLLYYICAVKFPDVKISILRHEKNNIRKLFKYSGNTFVIRIADILRFKIDSLVIGIFVNVNMITYYVIGSKLVEYFGSIMISTIGVFIPVFSKYEGMGDTVLLRKRFLEVTRIATIISIFIGTSIIIYGKAFIQRWMGPDFGISYNICIILCVPAIIALTQTPGIQLLYGISKHRNYAIINICEGLCNLVLSIVLVKYYGIYGVALGTAIEMIIFKSLIQPIVISKSINISYYEYFIKTILYTGAKAVVIVLGFYFVLNRYIEANYLTLIVIGTINTLLYATFAYFLLLNSDLRNTLMTILKKG